LPGRGSGSAISVGLTAAAIFFASPQRAAAEWQIKPFIGLTFGGGTTFVDLDFAVGTANRSFGVAGLFLGEVIGIEGDLSFQPGFFQTGDEGRIVRSSVRTLMGNFIVALPRQIAEYTLRPYFVAGMGAMHVEFNDNPPLVGPIFVQNDTLTAIDVGGGVTGFLSDHVGVSWDFRHFRGIGGKPKDRILTFPDGVSQRLSFWRANMALAVRF
jgi:outer membrane protein with beta-barrel domain